jgi:predicted DNA-binding transcriptional regulator AlpA
MSVVRPLSETVILNAPDVCVACGMAEKTFYNNIIELLDKRILSRKLGSSIEFWFDPNLFFNGNRIRVSDQRMSSLKT